MRASFDDLGDVGPLGISDTKRSSTDDAIRALSEAALKDPILAVVLETIGGYAMVIDAQRQILAANDELLDLLEVDERNTLIGLRPGEALDCVNSRRGCDGCGSSAQCQHCGAIAAILAAQASGVPVEGHCTLTSKARHNAVRCADYRIRISPLRLGDQPVYVFVVHDVTAVKWRELQERMFLHDLANMLTGLSGWSEEMAAAPSAAAAAEILSMARRLNDSLESHRLLLHLEAGQWTTHVVPIDLVETANTLQTWFASHECARQRTLEIHRVDRAGSLETDQQLLLRVLGNLIKNAFEAVPPDTTVTLTMSTDERASTVFEVHNPGAMDESVLKQLFRTRFSTKGADRGLGLRAVQVLGEHCLGGIVDCSSDPEHGTVFRFTLPNRATSAVGAAPRHSLVSPRAGR